MAYYIDRMEYPDPLPRSRSSAIDVFRGGLIVLVMLGHLSTLPVEQSQYKWVIYAFHMPLFLGLSGYLLNLDATRDMRFSAFLRRYGERLLIPWLVVFLITLPLAVRPLSAEGLLRAVLQPWNHLWFVPVFFAFVLIARFPLNRLLLFFLAMVVGIAGWWLFALGHHKGPLFGALLPDPRYFTMMPFFFFGLWLRAHDRLASWYGAAVLAAGLVLWALTFDRPTGIALGAAYLSMNLAAILTIPKIRHATWQNRFLEAIGTDSLFFYLFHPFLFVIAQKTLYHHVAWPIAWSVTLIVTVALLFAVRRLLQRWTITRLLTGLVRPSFITSTRPIALNNAPDRSASRSVSPR